MESLTELDRLDQLSSVQLDLVLDRLGAATSHITALQVAVLREVDRRQIPLGDGMPSLESWTVGRLDVDPDTARRLIAVARADSEELDRLLVDEGLSFDRVSELARADTTDPHLHLDMVGLKRCLRKRDRISVPDERQAFESRFVSIQPSLDASSWKLWGLLPALEGKTVAATLDAIADELPAQPHAESRSARRADALFMVCDRQAGDESTSDLVNTTVVVDAREAAATNGETGAWIVADRESDPTLSNGSSVLRLSRSSPEPQTGNHSPWARRQPPSLPAHADGCSPVTAGSVLLMGVVPVIDCNRIMFGTEARAGTTTPPISPACVGSTITS